MNWPGKNTFSCDTAVGPVILIIPKTSLLIHNQIHVSNGKQLHHAFHRPVSIAPGISISMFVEKYFQKVIINI